MGFVLIGDGHYKRHVYTFFFFFQYFKFVCIRNIYGLHGKVNTKTYFKKKILGSQKKRKNFVPPFDAHDDVN